MYLDRFCGHCILEWGGVHTSKGKNDCLVVFCFVCQFQSWQTFTNNYHLFKGGKYFIFFIGLDVFLADICTLSPDIFAKLPLMVHRNIQVF